MRAGLPVVATDVGGISESVREGETGLLTRHADVASLRDALARLIADPALRLALGSAGINSGAAQFTASKMAARTVEVYKRALRRLATGDIDRLTAPVYLHVHLGTWENGLKFTDLTMSPNKCGSSSVDGLPQVSHFETWDPP